MMRKVKNQSFVSWDQAITYIFQKIASLVGRPPTALKKISPSLHRKNSLKYLSGITSHREKVDMLRKEPLKNQNLWSLML